MHSQPQAQRQLQHLQHYVTNRFGCVARVRSSLAFATHEFFRKKGMLYVHTPLITASDCEGAGEMFQVTTLLDDYMKKDGEEGEFGRMLMFCILIVM